MERVDAECSWVIWRMEPSDKKVDAECSRVIWRMEPSDGKSGCRMQ